MALPLDPQLQTLLEIILTCLQRNSRRLLLGPSAADPFWGQVRGVRRVDSRREGGRGQDKARVYV